MEIWVEGRWCIEFYNARKFKDTTKSHNILTTLMFWVIVGLGIILIYFILNYGRITPQFYENIVRFCCVY